MLTVSNVLRYHFNLNAFHTYQKHKNETGIVSQITFGFTVLIAKSTRLKVELSDINMDIQCPLRIKASEMTEKPIHFTSNETGIVVQSDGGKWMSILLSHKSIVFLTIHTFFQDTKLISMLK